MAKRPGRKRIVYREPAPDVRLVVLAQPHRRGDASDRLSEPVGRLLAGCRYLTSGMSEKGLYDAAMRFGEAYSGWQSVVSSQRPFANSLAGSDAEMSKEDADRRRDRWTKAWKALRAAGEKAERAVFIAVIDPQLEEWRPPFWVQFACVDGLKALAEHFGIDIDGEDKEAPSQMRKAS